MVLGDAVAIASARGLTKIYGAGDGVVHALAGVDVDLVQGEFTAIMGPSGSGKSTLMHCLAGLDRPTSGTVEVAGEDITALNERALTKMRRTRLGFVFQAFNLVPTLTARENIRLPLEIARAKVDEEWFETIVNAVGLADRLDHRPAELSGGQQQRVACGRALIAKPALVFADEPTGNLDSVASAEVLGFLRRSVDELGQSVVMVTHEPFAAAFADRVLFLSDGVIVGELRNPTAESVLEAIRTYASQPPVPHSAALNLAKFTVADNAFGVDVDANSLEPATAVVPNIVDFGQNAMAEVGAVAEGGVRSVSSLDDISGLQGLRPEPLWNPQSPLSPSERPDTSVNPLGTVLPELALSPLEPATPAAPANAALVFRDTMPAGIERLAEIARGHNPPAKPAMPAIPGSLTPAPGPPTLVGHIPPVPAGPVNQLQGLHPGGAPALTASGPTGPSGPSGYPPAPAAAMGASPMGLPAPPARPPGGAPSPRGFDPTGLMPAISAPILGVPAAPSPAVGPVALQPVAPAVPAAPVVPAAAIAAPVATPGMPAPPNWSPGGSISSRVQLGSEPMTMVHPAIQAPLLGAAELSNASMAQAQPVPTQAPLPGQAVPNQAGTPWQQVAAAPMAQPGPMAQGWQQVPPAGQAPVPVQPQAVSGPPVAMPYQQPAAAMAPMPMPAAPPVAMPQGQARPYQGVVPPPAVPQAAKLPMPAPVVRPNPAPQAVPVEHKMPAPRLPIPEPVVARSLQAAPIPAPRPAWAPDVGGTQAKPASSGLWLAEKPLGPLGFVKTGGSQATGSPQFSGAFFSQSGGSGAGAKGAASGPGSGHLPESWVAALQSSSSSDAGQSDAAEPDVWPSPSPGHGGAQGGGRRRTT